MRINAVQLVTEPYTDQQNRLPVAGKHIIGQFTETSIVVYQAYTHSIADFAVKNQYLGGEGYSYTRMTWIKPNFLWMMFRSGWATKQNQERILAISLERSRFESILATGVHTMFKPHVYSSESVWKETMATSKVRIQWDPDHYPSGQVMARRAIQIGMKAMTAEKYAKEWITRIEDITEFVHTQRNELKTNGTKKLQVPIEEIYSVQTKELMHLLDL